MKNEKELLELINKWGNSKVAFPDSWSDERQLESANISYKTYSGGTDYKNIVITVGGTVEYDINVRYGKIEVTHPLSMPLTPAKALELVRTIYQEAISLESMVEGRAKLREDIAKKKKEAKSLLKEARKLESALESEDK